MQKIKLERASLAWAVRMLMEGYSVCLEKYENTKIKFFLSYYENGKMSDILENDKYQVSFTSSCFLRKAKGWKLYKKSSVKYEVMQEKDVEVAVGSLPWAIQMLIEGKRVTHNILYSSSSDFYLKIENELLVDEMGNAHFFNGFDFWRYKDGWQLAA